MAATPSRPFLLLCDSAVYNGEETMVECSSKVAYGCGPLGQQIVEGLTLFAGLDSEDYPGPALGVRATDEVLGRLGEEIPGVLAKILGSVEVANNLAELYGIDASLSGSVQAVDDAVGVVVLRVSFLAKYETRQIRSYYLVYDTAAASLSLLPRLPAHCPAVCTTRPLPVRSHHGGYSLVLMAVHSEPRTDDMSERPVLCLWSPPPASAPDSPSYDDDNHHGVGLWRIRQRRHHTAIPAAWFHALNADLQVFSYKGKAFWADLTQGILYCECADILNDGGDDAPAVDFTFVPLPEEYKIDTRLEHKRRAMGVGVGDTVWFVVLESCDHPGDTTVVVLSLDLSNGAAERRWERHLELSLLSIWALEGFVAAGLPRRVPWSPFLREQDAGVIYLFLPPADEKSERGCHLIGIDVRDPSEPRLQPTRRLADVPWVFNQQPLLLAPDFFDRPRN